MWWIYDPLRSVTVRVDSIDGRQKVKLGGLCTRRLEFVDIEPRIVGVASCAQREPGSQIVTGAITV